MNKPLDCIGIDPARQQTGKHDFRAHPADESVRRVGFRPTQAKTSHSPEEHLQIIRHVLERARLRGGQMHMQELAKACECVEEIAEAMKKSPTQVSRGLPMSVISPGMKLRCTTSETAPVITVVEITERGFFYTHEPKRCRDGIITGGECWGLEGWSFYELAETHGDGI